MWPCGQDQKFCWMKRGSCWAKSCLVRGVYMGMFWQIVRSALDFFETESIRGVRAQKLSIPGRRLRPPGVRRDQKFDALSIGVLEPCSSLTFFVSRMYTFILFKNTLLQNCIISSFFGSSDSGSSGTSIQTQETLVDFITLSCRCPALATLCLLISLYASIILLKATFGAFPESLRLSRPQFLRLALVELG